MHQYNISSPLESFRLACMLQDRGKALSTDDRISGAKKLYALGDQSQREIAKALGVSQSTVSSWLSRTLKEEKERKQTQASALWMACQTQEEIAAVVGVTQQTIANWEEEFTKKLAADNFVFSADFTPPLYNIWKQGEGQHH